MCWCRGYKRICGRNICPILLKVKSKLEIEKYLTSNGVFGADPPSIFVGSWGCLRVYIGPLMPPIEDRNTSIMNMPNLWLNLDWATILRYRFILFRGKLLKVAVARKSNKYVDYIQELAMSIKPVGTEINFDKKPTFKIRFWD